MMTTPVKAIARDQTHNKYVRSLFSGFGLSLFAMLCQLLIVPIYLRDLGRDGFGLLMIIISATNYAAIGVGWLSGSTARMLAECKASGEYAEFRLIYACAKVLFVIYAILMLPLFWVLISLPSLNVLNTNLYLYILISSIYFLFVYEYSIDRIAFVASHEQFSANVLDMIYVLIATTSALISLACGFGLLAVLLSFIFAAIMIRLCSWRVWKKHSIEFILPTGVQLKEFAKKTFDKTGRDYLIFGFIQLSLQSDILLIGMIAGPNAAALYFVVWRVPEVLILLFSKVPEAYAPFLILSYKLQNIKNINKRNIVGIYGMISGAIVAALLYGLFGHYLVAIWVGESAPQDAFAYWACAGAMFFTIAAKWPTMMAYWLKKTRPLLLIAGIELAVKVLLIVFIFRNEALTGYDIFFAPALATIIVHLLFAGLLYLWLGYASLSVKRTIH
jgi:O-antigen/teichoic acid export membrane protein